MEIIGDENKHCILMGVFNIDILKYSIHGKTTDYIDNIFSLGFIPLIHYPTRVQRSSATVIDHIYTNNIKPLYPVSGIIITDVADHYGTFHISKCKQINIPDLSYEKRSFSEFKIEIFKNI